MPVIIEGSDVWAFYVVLQRYPILKPEMHACVMEYRDVRKFVWIMHFSLLDNLYFITSCD